MAKTTRFFQCLIYFICAISLLSHNDAFARPRRTSDEFTSNPRYAMIMMDAQSGKILQEQNSTRALPPASLTKMMTLFLTFEAIQQRRLSMDSTLVITRNAMNQSPSKLGLRPNENIKVSEAIGVLVTRSANDVAMALAETIGGSEGRFIAMMNQRARSLGMKSSQFYTPSGLPHAGQTSSAYDMAILSRALMQYFPNQYHYFGLVRYNYRGRNIETHNNLMRRFKGMDGLKTGYTGKSGFNLAASAVRNNRRIIVVVFGGRSAASRDNQVANLMNQGLAMLDNKEMTTQIASNTTTTIRTPTAVVTETVVNTPAPQAQAASQIAPIAPVAKTTIQSRTDLASADRAGWRPDGGQIRTLQIPAAKQAAPANAGSIYPVAYNNAAAPAQAKNWGIQVGAFSSTSLSQQVLQSAQMRLRSASINSGQAVTVPSQTPQGTVYRARIVGLSATEASRACQLLSDCMAFNAP